MSKSEETLESNESASLEGSDDLPALTARNIYDGIGYAFGTENPGEESDDSTGGIGDLNPFPTDPEMVEEFVAESREHLSTIEDKILSLERDPSDKESVNAVFRGFHTIKGLAGFLDQARIQHVAHEVETLLDLVRSGTLTVNSNIVDVIFGATDFLHSEIDHLEQTARGETPEPPLDNTELLLRIAEASKPRRRAGDVGGPPATASPKSLPKDVLSRPGLAPAPVSAIDLAPPSAPREDGRHPETTLIRVEASKLDHLMNMVGELVIAQTMLAQSCQRIGAHDARLTGDLSLFARITADVLRVATGMRMVPIGIQFQKTSRLVRDLSRQFGKEVTLITEGDEMEIDRTIAEQLADPLMHMVRNSIDHGIEPPDLREFAGKAPVARITLRARLEGDQTVLEISDDGRGLDRAKILAKAAERGILGGIPNGGPPIEDDDVFALIFAPGFSTAEKVTGTSGRGVGMDVVRSHVEKMHGTIRIESTPGQGTTFIVRLPLTLAMMEGMVVKVGSSRYILPGTSVPQVVAPVPGQITKDGIDELCIVRGEPLPIVRLHERFRLIPRSLSLLEGVLLVCTSGGSKFCLFVDEALGTQEVAVQSLGETFKNAVGLAGCAVLADGCIGLILDIDGINNTDG